MNKPLVPEDLVKTARPSVYVFRAAAASLRSYATRGTPEYVAGKMFKGDVITPEILKAATAPAETAVTGWAAEIARLAIYDMLQSITSISAAAEVISRGLKITMDGIATHRVPGRVINPAQAGTWIAEGNPAPARALVFTNAAILQPRRLSVMYPYSREQAESSNIENIVKATMSESSGLALDAQMFSAAAGDASKPAGLLAGIAPLTPTAGFGVAARDADLKNLFAALAAQGAGKTAALICAMPQAVTLKASVGPSVARRFGSQPASAGFFRVPLAGEGPLLRSFERQMVSADKAVTLKRYGRNHRGGSFRCSLKITGNKNTT